MAIKKISANLLGSNAVTADKIADGAISAADIADNSITAAKISASTSPTFGGLNISTSATNSQSLLDLSSASGLRGKLGTDAQDDGFMYLYNSADDIKVAFRTDENDSYIAGGGNVGIGTNSPQHRLDIEENNAGADVRVNIVNSNGVATVGNEAILHLANTGSDSHGARLTAEFVGTANVTHETDLIFHTTGSNSQLTEAMRIDSSGNVGIGTTSPASMLHLSDGVTGVSGGEAAAITLTNKYDSPDNSWTIKPQRTGVSNTGLEIRDVTDSRTDMVFDGSGKVGIGTSSPAQTFHVNGASKFDGSTFGIAGLGTRVYTNTFTFSNTTGNKTITLTGLTYGTLNATGPFMFIISGGVLNDSFYYSQLFCQYRPDYVGLSQATAISVAERNASTAGQSLTFSINNPGLSANNTTVSLTATASGPDVGAGGYNHYLRVTVYRMDNGAY